MGSNVRTDERVCPYTQHKRSSSECHHIYIYIYAITHIYMNIHIICFSHDVVHLRERNTSSERRKMRQLFISLTTKHFYLFIFCSILLFPIKLIVICARGHSFPPSDCQGWTELEVGFYKLRVGIIAPVFIPIHQRWTGNSDIHAGRASLLSSRGKVNILRGEVI